MTEKPQENAQMSKLVEQSVSTLQEVDRRLQMVRTDLAALITKASALAQAGGQGMGFQGLGLGLMPGSPAGAPNVDPLGALRGLHGPFAAAPGMGTGMAGAVQPQGTPPMQGIFGMGGMGPMGPGMQGMGLGMGMGMGQGVGRSTRDLANLPPVPRVPTVDLVDLGEEFVMQVEVPGVKKEDLDILVSDRTITVSGQSRPEVGEGTLLLSERGAVAYRRTIPLPTEVQTMQSKATFKDGMLTLTVRKKVPSEGPRRVDVAYG